MTTTNKGLEGVVIGQTTISQVAGDVGQLIYGGYRIEDLAENASFEEVCHLLWYGDLPTTAQLTALHDRFTANMAVDERVIAVIRSIAADTHPMASLRTAVSALAAADPDAEDMSAEANDRKAVRLTAQAITLTAAIERIRNGRDPIQPRDDLSLAANLLYMMHGEAPDELAERIIDASLILHAEHGMNASTFSARVTASTLADMHSAVTSAIGTLKGPLHGGANEQVMHMLLKIDRPENAAEWVRAALGRGEKIMGFGHRVYRTVDPRAPILKKLAEQLLEQGGDTRWLEVSEIIQTTMREEMDRKGKKIYPNVDFFSASVYYTLGIPMDLFTNLFACARMAGWTAHVKEQLGDNRLIRPKAEYVGPRDRSVAPVEQRT